MSRRIEATLPAESARDGPTAARYTLVAFHAHPDDEALFTGGTLARAAAEGHRVILVTATAGERGLAAEGTKDLGDVRLRELKRAAGLLGVSRLVTLGYGDSGMDSAVTPPPGSLCAVPISEIAARLAAVLTEERADVLTIYDANGGYGHRDHIRVHDAGIVAATSAGTARVLEATVPRETLMRGVRLLNRFGVRPGGMTADSFLSAYRARAEITHEIDVRPWLAAKRAALAAHASQASGGGDVRTIKLLSRLPRPLARKVLGREWFVEITPSGEPPQEGHLAHELFMSLQDG
jgi:LmbE family N-acetylglucosaminyl deacetylase